MLTGNGPSPKDGGWAFCSGGDQRIRGKDGYKYAEGETADTVDPGKLGRLHILEVQRLIRFMPKIVICVVPGWAAGGGHSLHVVCDLTLASARARPLQADGRRRRVVRRRLRLGVPGAPGRPEVRPRDLLPRRRSTRPKRCSPWAQSTRSCRTPNWRRWPSSGARIINGKSPTAQKMLKYSFNLIDDGLVGQQVLLGETTRLAYMTDEAAEGRDAFLEKRHARFSAYPVALLKPVALHLA